MTVTTIAGLEQATRLLGGSVLGPTEVGKALGFDPLSVLTPAERAAVATVPFDVQEIEAAQKAGAILVLRVPRSPKGPLTMQTLAEHFRDGFDPKVHQGVGYSLRGEWTIDDQPFATTETCTAGWRLVSRALDPATTNRAYRDQDDRLAPSPSAVPVRRSAIEISYDTLLWHRMTGERLLTDTWDWSRSPSTDQGFAALGEFSERGLRVTAYSRAVKFGTLGVCPQR
jgi:hypothetical protein